MISPPNPAAFQQRMSKLTVTLRDTFSDVQNLNDYITAAGGATFLESVIGMSPDDAAVAVSTFANLAALAGVYDGGSPVAQLNFRANSNLLWAGQ